MRSGAYANFAFERPCAFLSSRVLDCYVNSACFWRCVHFLFVVEFWQVVWKQHYNRINNLPFLEERWIPRKMQYCVYTNQRLPFTTICVVLLFSFCQIFQSPNFFFPTKNHSLKCFVVVYSAHIHFFKVSTSFSSSAHSNYPSYIFSSNIKISFELLQKAW